MKFLVESIVVEIVQPDEQTVRLVFRQVNPFLPIFDGELAARFIEACPMLAQVNGVFLITHPSFLPSR
jgi:hypothetical protein